MIQKLLIANRGEIASRIIRTCREQGIQTVAVYSQADLEMPFVKMADESYLIGEPPVAKSYLQMDTIIDVAKKVCADAVHPGYGLLSENATFAQKVLDAGLIWVGPKPSVIAQMGDKVTARQVMIEANVPVVPGSGEIVTWEEAVHIANQIGYPVLLKASAGGGGVGMVLCHSDKQLEQHFATTQKRAGMYFGSSAVFLEKFLERSRHIEVQVLADQHGNALHLFERECSVQRRNQKIIEESLSPSISQEAREKLYQTALQAVHAVGYYGAGTVEFLVDQQENCYFIEMNTRLQVEHPVTESITGLDLVSWQLAIAEEKALPWKQTDLQPQGHAIEYRLYAEDPVTFFPSPGKIEVFSLPEGAGIRFDAGVEAGNTITPFYDPMIAKCIISGSSREEVLTRSRETFSQMKIEGIKCNLPLLVELLDHPDFVSGKYDTTILANRKGK
ncbi:acetyl-CoA carboxylase, biotin carboxylase subunit [Thermoactinomyces sp. DSM 45891]|uniref:acetyl-CoA carboxylase biotin carboxylase subunit n=1 Tax=Thermoactinomyces sp. DSM 45891 TaxID=1761907 RepID=UPI0009169E3C|nr:acetyl-CoA carboxylase, biotin carboxylase subunit [Thermoactinomyces sp. DSM 45891]